MPVIYTGVPGTGEGDLFQGLKLWIAQRVPQRARWVDLVKGNGGEIVRLEKNADMLIADNIKVAGVSPPLGSYMWRWIDDSIKNGFLQDKDDYLIGRREGSAREAGTSQPIKVGRTPFTKKDDLILTKWVVAEERMGSVLSGNVIYKALERKHPHHTWQSWRDRWVKGLRSKPRPTFTDEEILEEIDQHRNQSPEPAPGSASASRRPQTRQPVPLQPASSKKQSGPSASPVRASISVAPTSSGHARPRGKAYFTEEEDQLLLDLIEEVRRKNRKKGREENKNLGGNVIYQDFAQEHPTHSWHSWRDRWVRHLSLMEAVDDEGPDEASSACPDPGEAQHLNKRQVQQPRVNDGADQPATTEPISGSPSAQQQPNPKSDDERLKRKLHEKKEARAALLIEKNWRGHAVRRDMARLEAAVVPLQSAMRGFVARLRMASLAEAHKADDAPSEADLSQGDEHSEDAAEYLQRADTGSHGMSPEEPDPRGQFYNDLEVVVEVIGAEIDREPTISGRQIDLWDLYRLAQEQDCELEARDWKLITEGLGFEPAKGIVYKVQACYLQNLAEFEQHITTFECDDAMDEEAVDEDEEEETGHGAAVRKLQPKSDFATAPKQPVDDPSSPAYQSSPPVARPKRSLEQTDLLRSDSGYPSSGPRKRRRVDRNSVIPPTPDEKLGLLNNLPHSHATQDDSSPLKPKALSDGDAVEISSEAGSEGSMNDNMSGLEEQIELPARSHSPKKGFVEPETQDWHVPQEYFLLDGEDEVSPSQQLLLESDAVQSPQQVVPSSRSAIAEENHLSSPAAESSRGVRASNTRTLRSNPGQAAKPATLASTSRAVIGGQVKKRTLPAAYQQKTGPTAAAISTATLASGQAVLQSPVQSKGMIVARPSSVSPVRANISSTTRPRQVNAHAPETTMGSLASQSLALPPATAPHHTSNEKTSDPEESERWEEAHVEAQFRHFQALGYKTDHISKAMNAATMSRGPMIVALQSLHNGKGLPENERGVWTPQDCNNLVMVKRHEREVGKGKGIAGPADGKMKVMAWNLEKKHGKKGMMDRWVFMQLLGQTAGI